MAEDKKRLHIVHGWTYSLGAWDSFIAMMKERGVEVVMHKVPGLSAPSDEVWTIPGYVEWLRSEIKDEKSPTVLGHSNGGRILLGYIQAYPKHIGHLILLDSAGVYDEGAGVSTKRKLFGSLSKLIPSSLMSNSGMRRVIYRLMGARDYGDAPENMRETMKNMLDYDKQLSLKGVKVKTSFIWGEKDKATPIWMADRLKMGFEFVLGYKIIDGSGHSPHKDNPKELCDEVTLQMEKA